MGFLDLILFPLYLLLFNFIFKSLRKTYKDPLLRKYHKEGFWIKVVGCIAFIIFNAYLSPGDSMGLYYKEGANIHNLILHDSRNIHMLFIDGKDFDESQLKDIWNAGYFKTDSNFLVTKIVTVFSFVTFAKYSVLNLMFALIAFTGSWKLFLFFYEQYPQMHKKFAIGILYLPTFVFWSAGVLKDSICIGALGWITYGLYEIFYRKKGIIKNSVIIVIYSYFLIVLKVYILISYVPFFMLFIILKNVATLNNKLIKYLLAPALIIGSMIGFTKVLKTYGNELGQYAVKDLTKSIKFYNKAYEMQTDNGSSNSNFSLGVDFDGSVTGLVKLAPVAVATTFFRPFLWESRKPSTLLSSIEALILMLFTIYVIFKAGILNFFKLMSSDPLIMYCFLFSIIFALFVGASTLNFGTLVRYKIPCMPFYIISLFLIYEKVKIKASSKIIAQQPTTENIFIDRQKVPQLTYS